MILQRRSTAWLLAALQTLFSTFFTRYLSGLLHSGPFQAVETPTWFTTLAALNFGLALILVLTALWKFEWGAVILLLAAHIVCPILFFTDLTRNPYFTQIVLLNIWIAFLWIGWIWESALNGKITFPKTALDRPLLAFLLITLVSWGASFITHESSFHAAMFSEGLKAALFLIVNGIAVFYLAAMVDDRWRARFIWVTFLVGTAAAVYGLMQFYGWERIWQKTLTPFANRPVSTFGNPNFLSSYLVMIAPLVIAFMLFTRRKGVFYLCVFILVSFITGLIATMTRSSWVGLLLALSLLPLARSVREFVRRHAAKIGVVVALLLCTIVFWPKSKLGGYENPLQRILEIRNVKNPNGYGPWHQRILIWSSCWEMVRDHPFLGKGWGELELFYPYYQGRSLWNPLFRSYRTHANNAHNEALEVWSQTGFLGMGIYVWLWLVFVLYGVKLARQYEAANPEKSILAWVLTAASLGMLTDNFFGNVSIHFAVPAFLFWWQAGLLFGLRKFESQGGRSDGPLHPAEWYLVPSANNLHKTILSGAALFLLAVCVWNFRREFQEIYYFRGFKIAKSTNLLDAARQELEQAWLWYPREVNSNYELANAYARLAQQSAQMGLAAQSENWRKKAVWGYLESLRSNCGYDEIYFNLAAIQSQENWQTDDHTDLSLETPRGLPAVENARAIRGALANYSRAIAINPLSQEGYSFLGNLLLQKQEERRNQAALLFRQATLFYPEVKDFWVNLAYLQIQQKKWEEAYPSLSRAMELDPFYELTRRNLRVYFEKSGKTKDPLLDVEKMLPQIQPLIQARNWRDLRGLIERLLAILPESPQLRVISGNVLFELKEWGKAEQEYLRALPMEPANLTLLHNLALVYMAQGRPAEARRTYQRILTLNPGDATAQEQLKRLPV